MNGHKIEPKHRFDKLCGDFDDFGYLGQALGEV